MMDDDLECEEENPPPFDGDGNLRVQLAIMAEIRTEMSR